MLMRPLLAVLPLLALSLAVAQSDEDPAQPLRECGGTAALGLPAGVQPGLYRGTLAGKTILLQLLASRPSQAESDPADRYAYGVHGIDITLNRGRSAAGGLLLAEFKRDYPKLNATGCFELTGAAGKLSGSWRAPGSQKRYPVIFSPVKLAAEPLSLPATPGLLALRARDPFMFLKLNHPWKAAGSAVTEPLSQVSYPRVAGGSAALNAALQDQQLSLAAQLLDCISLDLAFTGHADGGADANSNDQLNFTDAKLTLKSAQLLSVYNSSYLYCGGAHPNFVGEGRTYDLSSGQVVPLAGKPSSIWPALTPAALQKLYLARYPRTGDAECKDAVRMNDTPDADSFQLYLTRSGLTLAPAFLPHVDTACGEEVTLPYADLRAYAAANGRYFRDLYPR